MVLESIENSLNESRKVDLGEACPELDGQYNVQDLVGAADHSVPVSSAYGLPTATESLHSLQSSLSILQTIILND
jgi:hypothetical protein